MNDIKQLRKDQLVRVVLANGSVIAGTVSVVKEDQSMAVVIEESRRSAIIRYAFPLDCCMVGKTKVLGVQAFNVQSFDELLTAILKVVRARRRKAERRLER